MIVPTSPELIETRDEILYHARIHPEQYSNTLTDAQLKQLHTSILHICSTAVDLLADSSRFPEEWLFKHRWGKGKKDQKKELPNGEKIVHITVGGRTSAVVPSVQKKTGPVAGDIKSEDIEGNSGSGEEKEPKTAKRKTPNARPSTKKEVHDTEAQNTITYATKSRGKKDENQSDQEKDLVKPSAKKRKSVSQTGTNGLVKEEKAKKSKTSSKVKGAEDTGLASGRRRSTRASGRGS